MGKYRRVGEVAVDVELMFANCELYNDPRSHIGMEAERLRGILEKSLRHL
jgi:hypothetical protein